MNSLRETVGFGKERSCMSNEPLALTLRCLHTTIGIPGEEFYWFQWHGLSAGLGILHFTGWGDERRITIVQFKHALITLSGFYSVLQQLLITVLKGEGEQFLPSTLWHSNCWNYTRIPRADAIFSGGSSSSPNANTVCCLASHTHIHTDFCFASARLKLHRPDAESSSQFSIYLEKNTFFFSKTHISFGAQHTFLFLLLLRPCIFPYTF